MSFLTAEWRDLAILNWEIPSELLAPLIPKGTELDTWNGRAYVSLVGFRFLKTRVMKLAIPRHTAFEELNLRFYVKRHFHGELRRGVVFIKEIVPRACVAILARRLYNENYFTAPMSHEIERREDRTRVRYEWTIGERSHSISLAGAGGFERPAPGSESEFIVEHYWGYCRQRDGGTIEYRVNHPPWRVAAVDEFTLDCDAAALYGEEFGRRMSAPPASALLADGSAVEVGFGQRF